MRFIITAQSDAASTQPAQAAEFDAELFKAYMRFNEAMHRAGVLVASEGLNPAAQGARIAVANGKRYVVDGPFAESKELVGGFYIIEVDSLDEAIAWALRAPTGLGSDDILEVRQLTGAEDLPEELLTLIREAAPDWSASWERSRAARRAARSAGAIPTGAGSEEMKALEDFFAAINRNDMEAATRHFDPQIVRVEPEGFPTSGTYRGAAEVQAHVARGRGTWAEGSCDPEKMLVHDDKVVVYLHVRVRLKDDKDWIDARFADGFLFRNGRISEYLTFARRADALKWAGIEQPE